MPEVNTTRASRQATTRRATVDSYSPEDSLAWAVEAVNDPNLARRYARYRRYYDGDHDLSFASPRYQTTFGRIFDGFTYNRCASVVDAHSDRLYLEKFEVPTSEGVGQLANDIWAMNRMDKRQDEVYTEALTMGDGYVLVWPDDTGQPVIWPQRASDVRVRYSDERLGELTLACKVWVSGGRIRLNVYTADRIERYVTVQTKKSGAKLDVRHFAPWEGDAAGPVVPNPWGRIPMFAFANNARTGDQGVSELRDIVALQNALNKALMDLMVTQEFAAFTQKVIIGVETSSDPYTSSNPDQGAATEAGLRNFAMGVDRILTIADPAAKIAEFSAAALQQFTDVAEAWDTRISRVSKVPVHYLTLSSNFPSGRALRTAEAPFVAKLEDRQRAFGAIWEDAMRFALRIMGVEVDGDVQATWRSDAPMAEEDSWDLVMQQVSAGVPLEIAVEKELGWGRDDLVRLTAALEAKAQADALAMMVQPLTAAPEQATGEPPPDGPLVA